VAIVQIIARILLLIHTIRVVIDDVSFVLHSPAPVAGGGRATSGAGWGGRRSGHHTNHGQNTTTNLSNTSRN